MLCAKHNISADLVVTSCPPHDAGVRIEPQPNANFNFVCCTCRDARTDQGKTINYLVRKLRIGAMAIGELALWWKSWVQLMQRTDFYILFMLHRSRSTHQLLTHRRYIYKIELR